MEDREKLARSGWVEAGEVVTGGVAGGGCEGGTGEKRVMATVALVGSSTCVSSRAGKEEEVRSACGIRAAVMESVVRWESGRVDCIRVVTPMVV
jgi:hypothetical protein